MSSLPLLATFDRFQNGLCMVEIFDMTEELRLGGENLAACDALGLLADQYQAVKIPS
jgi:hypothetical protein